MHTSTPTTVYYNSACPVCDAGITAQKTKMQTCNIEWIDVHTHPDAALEIGADLAAVRERLYVKDADGNIQIGIAALAELWAKTPGQKWLGRIAQWPVMDALLALAYNTFAKGLYRWNRWKKHW